MIESDSNAATILRMKASVNSRFACKHSVDAKPEGVVHDDIVAEDHKSMMVSA